MKRFLLLFVAATVACMSACVTTRPSGYKLVVGNATNKAVSNVAVDFGGTPVSAIPALKPNAFQASPRMSVAHPASARLTWTNAAGQPRAATIKAQKVLPSDFAGVVYYQIQPDDTVKVFIEAAASGPQSDLPWSKPENWEGVPGIPGLSAPE